MIKKILLFSLITIALFGVTFFFKSQTPINELNDFLNIDQFDLKPIDYSLQGQNTLKLDKFLFIQKFGQPQAENSEFNEMDDENNDVLYYDGLKVFFSNNSISHLTFTNSNYCLEINGSIRIRVGDSKEDIIRLFKNAWDNRTMPNTIFIAIEESGTYYDNNLVISFDENTNKVSEVGFH